VDWSDLEVDRLQAAEGVLDLGEAFVRPHGGVRIEIGGAERGTNDVEAVEPGLGGDRREVAPVGEVALGDVDPEVPFRTGCADRDCQEFRAGWA